jgi:hypothetical protein
MVQMTLLAADQSAPILVDRGELTARRFAEPNDRLSTRQTSVRKARATAGDPCQNRFRVGVVRRSATRATETGIAI